MMICLLRNIGGLSKPSNGWDQLPHPTDTSPGAALAILKWYRNQLAHTTVSSMDKKEFTLKWTKVDNALTSLNNGQRPQQVTEILSYDLDGEQAKTLAKEELKQLTKDYLDCEKEKEQIEYEYTYYRERNLPKNIEEANAAFVETWVKDDENFCETMGSKLVYDKVKDCNCIVVTSNLGLGKTATIRHIALKFQLEGFELVPVESPIDIIQYKTNRKQMFLIDDVLGKHSLSPTLLGKWERFNDKLMSCLNTENGSKKILCTLRLQIALQKRFKTALTILNKEVINLEHESNALSKEEKQIILLKHLRSSTIEKEIKTEELESMCETNYAFPLLCKLISTNEERFKKRMTFFKQPLSLLNEELDKLRNDDKTLYCTLVICMLFDGSLSRSMLDIDSNESDEKIYKIMQTCGLQNMSKKALGESAFSALGSYLTKDSYNFRFIHDALEETVGFHFCTFNPKEMFEDCNILFIRDRVRVNSNVNTDGNFEQNIVILREDDLNEDHVKPLYTRLRTELERGRFSNLLMSGLCKNRNFVEIFGNHIKTNQRKMELTGPFMGNSSERNQSNDQSFLKRIFDIASKNEFQDNKDAISRVIEASTKRSKLLNWIVAFGCYEFFTLVWSAITHSDRKGILGRDDEYNTDLSPGVKQSPKPFSKSFFPLSVLGGSLDIVKTLISEAADVNCFSEFFETPLYIAVKSGRYDMVHLLLNHGAQINRRLWFDMKIPVLVTSNNYRLTSLILQYDLNQTKLHKAVRHNDLHILRSNISSDIIDHKTKSGWTVLHYVVLLDNLEALKVLFDDGLSQSDDSFFSRRPTPSVNLVDNNGHTALYLAVINNNIEILSLLLRNKADVNIRDDFNRLPLHYTTSQSVTQLLLTHNSQNKYGKGPISVFKTACLNITLQTAFKNVCRDSVNMPDNEGNTPLHSVINRYLIKKESSDCIETLLENGANPCLFNNMGISALELSNCCDTEGRYINNIAKYKQSLDKTHIVFAFATFLFIAFAIGLLLSFPYPYIINTENQNACYCNGQVTESDNITLIQVTRSIYGIILILLPFLLFSLIMYDHRYSGHLRWFLILLLIECGSFVSIGVFVYVHFIYNFMFTLTVIIICHMLSIKIMESSTYGIFKIFKDRKILNMNCSQLYEWCVLYVFLFIFVVGLLPIVFYVKIFKYNLYAMPDINTLKLTALNCTEFSPLNISCTSSPYNITYKRDVDFSVQCRYDPNITSYNGTFIVESEVIDWSVMVHINLFWLHVICMYFFIYCISVLGKKVVTLTSNNFVHKPKIQMINYSVIFLFLYFIMLSVIYVDKENK
ncbi:uncharacterized protein LOC134694863 [Mytilus trossulus]|uniref:uncharacterized protein LOC134694863 n=1 Tax=Mytilus trossulus TaxID=6551 RepID=UPI0030058893